MHFKAKLFLTVIMLFICIGAKAQVATGSLGDPVVQEDFGNGSNPHYPNTTYPRIGGSCPEDGYYALAKTESGCHDTWHTILKDHTGNDGYMMIVNASALPGEFYTQETPPLLCGGTTYEFSAYVKNLVLPIYANIHEKPNLTFRIENLNGDLIDSYDTGPIYETAGADDWQRVSKVFTLPLNANAVIVKIINNAPGGAGNDLVLDDIAFRAYGPVLQASFSGDAAVTQSYVCQGNAASCDITATTGPGYNNPKYQWQKNDGNGWVDVTTETTTSIHVVIPSTASTGIIQYRLGVAEGDNINSLNCRVYSNPAAINITAYPTPAALQPTSVCEGETLTLTADGGTTYKWTGPGISGYDSHNPLVIPNVSAGNAGHYQVEVVSQGDCSTTLNVDVTVNLKPVIVLNNVPPVCKGTSTQLTAGVSNAGSYTYSWLPAAGLSDPHSATPMAGPNVSTLYTVTVTNNITNCSATQQVQVNVIDVPVADAGTDKKIFEGQSVQLGGNLNSSNVLSYSWSPADYLNDAHSPTPVANPPYDVNYLLTVTSDNGCGIITDEVFVRVFQKIVIPNTFSPNNDGMNDFWNIEALETYPQSTVYIYNRNGRQVFQSTGYSKPWDGKFNGSPLPTGTYYYVINLQNGTPKLSGWVFLVR